MTDASGSPSVGHAIGWNALNTAVTKVVSIVAGAIVLRIVSPEDFGAFTVAAAVYAVVVGAADLGLAATLSRRDLSVSFIAPTVSALATLSSLVAAAAMFFGADFLATALGTPTAANAIQIMSICVLMSGIMAVPTGILSRELGQKRLFIANAVSILPSNILLIWLAVDGQGADAFAWSRVLGQAIVSIAILGRGRYPRFPRVNRDALRQVIAFGLPFAGANLIGYALLNADYVIMGRFIGAVGIGIYALAFNVSSWPTSILGTAINSVGIPVFSRHANDRAALHAVARLAVRRTALVAFPLSAFLFLAREPVIDIIYGPKWSESAVVLGYLSVYGAFFAVSLVFANLLSGTARTGRLLLIQLLWLVALVPAMIFGANLAGAVGVAAAHSAVLLVIVLPAYWLALRTTIPSLLALLFSALSRPTVATLAALAAAWPTQLFLENDWLKVIVAGLVGGLVYGAVMWREVVALVPERYGSKRPSRARPMDAKDSDASEPARISREMADPEEGEREA